MLLPEDLSPPPFSDEELDDFFAWQDQQIIYTVDDPTAPPEPPVARWQITDTGSAEFAMSRYSHTAARIEEAELAAKEFHRQIDDWLRRETLPLHHRANFFFGHLTRFLQDRREDPSDGRATVKLPSGDIVSRKVPARPEIVKEAEQDFIEWAQAHAPEIVKAKWSPVMAEVKKRIVFTEDGRALYPDEDSYTGECIEVPGVVQVPEHVNYDVKQARP